MATERIISQLSEGVEGPVFIEVIVDLKSDFCVWLREKSVAMATG